MRGVQVPTKPKRAYTGAFLQYTLLRASCRSHEYELSPLPSGQFQTLIPVRSRSHQ